MDRIFYCKDIHSPFFNRFIIVPHAEQMIIYNLTGFYFKNEDEELIAIGTADDSVYADEQGRDVITLLEGGIFDFDSASREIFDSEGTLTTADDWLQSMMVATWLPDQFSKTIQLINYEHPPVCAWEDVTADFSEMFEVAAHADVIESREFNFGYIREVLKLNGIYYYSHHSLADFTTLPFVQYEVIGAQEESSESGSA